jgi:hypothetical protein
LVAELSLCSFTENVPDDARRGDVADEVAMAVPAGPWMRMMASDPIFDGVWVRATSATYG